MGRRAVAVDAGSHSIKAMVVRDGKRGLAVLRFCAVPAAEGADGLREAGLPLRGAVAGLAGRDMTLRYSQVPPSPDWQIRSLVELEIQDLSAQSGGDLAADYNLIPGVEDDDGGMETILLALARTEALEATAALAAGAGGSVDGHVPNCIALYNAYLRCGPVEEGTVACLANLGHETIDIALVRGVDLLFARNLSGGGKVLDDAISSAFNVSARKAESLKKDLLDLDPESRGRYASGQAEKVTLAAGGAASAVASAIQSSLAFCRTQMKAEVELDKVWLTGGSARLRGVRGMLREALRCPVELFDPFDNVDLSPLPSHEAAQLDKLRRESVVALGLAAGRLDDTLYELEILPERIRRRKRLRERTVYNIAAALIGVLLLVLQAVQARRDLQEATQRLRRARTVVASAETTHREAETLVEGNQRQRAMVEYLGERALPNAGVISTMRALYATLPDALWIQEVDLVPARGGRRNGTVEVIGQGKELHGVDVADVYDRFNNAFRSHPLIRGRPLNARTETEGSGETLTFTFNIDFGAAPEE